MSTGKWRLPLGKAKKPLSRIQMFEGRTVLSKFTKTLWLVMVFPFLMPPLAQGNVEKVGHIMAIRGQVLIARDKQAVKAESGGALYLNDTISTKSDARVKMRFTDDSVLTLTSNSRLNIKQYLYGRSDEQGGSIFELLDGQLRTLVGQGDLEIHTPTAVAAARGTFFFVQVKYINNVVVTEISLLEGTLEVKSSDSTKGDTVILSPGETTTVGLEEPLLPPVPITESQLKGLLNCSQTDLETFDNQK